MNKQQAVARAEYMADWYKAPGSGYYVAQSRNGQYLISSQPQEYPRAWTLPEFIRLFGQGAQT